MIKTDAWVLPAGASREPDARRMPGELRLETITLADLGPHDVLAEPLYGCWEGNMSHAISRWPVDVCHQREEAGVVLGNAGVVRVLQLGPAVKNLREGDVCCLFGSAVRDEHGYTVKSHAYDAPGTMGMLAKRVRLASDVLIPLPNTRHALSRWAGFSARYITAWGNWRVASGCWRVQVGADARPIVWGWGGGTALAEVSLALLQGCPAALISSDPRRLQEIARLGLKAVDRREFAGLNYDDERFRTEADYREAYLTAEQTFVSVVREQTGGRMVSIFVDNIGTPVFRATLKALAREGVITTAGWKGGMKLSAMRALECINRHIHVHTHFASYAEACDAVAFAERHEWLPPTAGEQVYSWEEIPLLARKHLDGKVSSFFPTFRVNPV